MWPGYLARGLDMACGQDTWHVAWIPGTYPDVVPAARTCLHVRPGSLTYTRVSLQYNHAPPPKACRVGTRTTVLLCVGTPTTMLLLHDNLIKFCLYRDRAKVAQ